MAAPSSDPSISARVRAAPLIHRARRLWSSPATLRAVQVALLTAVLGMHFLMRWHVAEAMPLAARHFYPQDYLPSIRMAATHRLTGHLPERIWANTPETNPLTRPEAAPVREFLSLMRPAVTADEERAFLNAPGARVELTCFGRVLDIYLAALVWRVMGTSWAAFFFVYCLISTFACWMVASIARTLTGSFWAGALAAFFFATSPLESEYTMWSVRDTSPLWFAALAVWCFARFVVPADRPGLPHLALGVASAVGLGWRPDTLILLPLTAGALVIAAVLRHRRLRPVLAAVALFAVGAAATRGGISLAGPKSDIPDEAGFHVAYYGNWTRANLLGIENSFEISRSDRHVELAVHDYNAATARFPGVGYLDGPYGTLVRDMYLESLRYYAYRLVTGYPSSTWRSLSGLSTDGALEGVPLEVVARDRYPLHWTYDRVLDPLRRAVPALALVGAFCGLAFGRKRLIAGVLIVFLLYYAAILLLVLPETKHTLPLLLPTSIFAAVAVWGTTRWRTAHGVARREIRSIDGPRAARLVAILGGGIALGLLACSASAAVSRGARAAHLREIARMPSVSVHSSAIGPGAKDFAVNGMPGTRCGYLLTIAGGDGLLTVRYFANATALGLSFLTHHALARQPTQYFYFTFPARGFVRAGVALEGSGTIVSARRLDTSRWRRPAFSTVYASPDESPGAPLLPEGVLAAEFFNSALVDQLGIVSAEGWKLLRGNVAGDLAGDGGHLYLRLKRTQAGAIPVAAFRPMAGATIREEGGALTLTSPAGRTSQAAELTVEAAQEGLYTFVLKDRVLEGSIQFGLLTADRSQWLALATAETVGGTFFNVCTVRLRRQERAHLVMANDSLAVVERPSRVVLEEILAIAHPVPGGLATTSP